LNEATAEPDMLPAETASSAQPAQSVSLGEPGNQPESPFGPANPEFVALPDPTEGSSIADSSQSQFPQWDAAPEAPSQLDVQTASARLVQPAGDTAPQTQTTTNTSDTIEFTPAAGATGLVDFAEIDALLEQGDDVGAHRQLSTMYWEHPETRPQLMDRIQQTARRIYFQPIPHYMEPNVVQPADTLQSIAHRYGVPWQFLAKLNEVEPTRIRPGQELKVIRGPFAAVVDLSDHEFTVHAHGYFVCSFPVGIGQDGSTPTGTFEVEDKLVDPTYYGPEGVIAHDDPTNPLGEHWISIGNSYGIHGTIEPDSIGRDESQGCVRLRNEDVAEVYDFLSIGSEVVIRD
jgi:lipoprotein-anchoring transpeptidase ErfK/SrfK